jgi:hypothetical protein
MPIHAMPYYGSGAAGLRFVVKYPPVNDAEAILGFTIPLKVPVPPNL